MSRLTDAMALQRGLENGSCRHQGARSRFPGGAGCRQVIGEGGLRALLLIPERRAEDAAMRATVFIFGFVAVLSTAGISLARAADVPVDLELVLAVDVSR